MSVPERTQAEIDALTQDKYKYKHHEDGCLSVTSGKSVGVGSCDDPAAQWLKRDDGKLESVKYPDHCMHAWENRFVWATPCADDRNDAQIMSYENNTLKFTNDQCLYKSVTTRDGLRQFARGADCTSGVTQLQEEMIPYSTGDPIVEDATPTQTGNGKDSDVGTVDDTYVPPKDDPYIPPMDEKVKEEGISWMVIGGIASAVFVFLILLYIIVF